MKVEFNEELLPFSLRERFNVVGVGRLKECPDDCYVTWGSFIECVPKFEVISSVVGQDDIVVYLKKKVTYRKPRWEDALTFKKVINKQSGEKGVLSGFVRHGSFGFFLVSFKGKNPVPAYEHEIYIEENK